MGTNVNLYRENPITGQRDIIGTWDGVNLTLDPSNFGNGNVRIGDVNNYTEFKPDGEINLIGTAKVERHIHIPTANLTPGVAPTSAVIGHFPVLQFSQAVTQTVFGVLHVPTDWAIGTDMEAHVHWAPVNAAAGNVVWDLDYKSVKSNNDEIISGTQRSLTVTASTEERQDELLRSDSMIIPAGDLEELDLIGFCLSRDTGDVADTYAVAASLVFFEIIYKINRLGIAT